VKNSVYLQYPLRLLINRVLQLKQRSQSISIAGARQRTRFRIYIPPFLDEKGASVIGTSEKVPKSEGSEPHGKS